MSEFNSRRMLKLMAISALRQFSNSTQNAINLFRLKALSQAMRIQMKWKKILKHRCTPHTNKSSIKSKLEGWGSSWIWSQGQFSQVEALRQISLKKSASSMQREYSYMAPQARAKRSWPDSYLKYLMRNIKSSMAPRSWASISATGKRSWENTLSQPSENGRKRDMRVHCMLSYSTKLIQSPRREALPIQLILTP